MQKVKKNDFSKIIYENHTLEDLVLNIENIDPIKVIEQIHIRICNWKIVQKNDSSIDPFGISFIINAIRDNDSMLFSVMYRHNDNNNSLKLLDKQISIEPSFNAFSVKHIKKLEKGMIENKCKRGVIYTNAKSIPSAIYKIANESNIEIVDYEDLLQLAKMTDLKK